MVPGKGRSITLYILRVNDAEQDMLCWIEWIVVKSLPLAIVDDPLTRNGMRYKAITTKLLRKYPGHCKGDGGINCRKAVTQCSNCL